MTYLEIEKIIKDNKLQKAFFYSQDIDPDHGQFYETCTEMELFQSHDSVIGINSKLDDLKLKNFENVSHVCNSDNVQSVVHFKDEDIYIEFTGWYDSYEGYDHDIYDDIKQVFPKPIEKVIYE